MEYAVKATRRNFLWSQKVALTDILATKDVIPKAAVFKAQKISPAIITIDNRWIVPHSPYLHRVFACHINVELCTSVKSIKYVLKYVRKGSDIAVFGLQNNNPSDEISSYQTARCISAAKLAGNSSIFLFTIVIHQS